jgi:amidase
LSEWRVDKTQIEEKLLVDLPRTSGLLTDKEVLITELTAVEILAAIREQRLTAMETTKAFCKLETIAHQAVRHPEEIEFEHVLMYFLDLKQTNCLTKILFNKALQQAAQLMNI